MSFIYTQNLIEYAIRIGVDDLIKNPLLVNLAFFTDPQKNIGQDLTPPPTTQDPNPKTVREPLPTDFFQQRLSQIQKVRDETGRLDIFKNSIPSVVDIEKYLQNANINIIHGYPRTQQDLPCLAITLGNEDEESNYLGTRKATFSVPTGPALPDGTVPTKKFNMVGSDWSAQYQIHCMSTNYDEVEVWYFILKYCLTVYRPALEAYGIREQKLSFGDLEPAPEYLDSGLFVYQRTCTLSCVKDEDIPVPAEGAFESLAFNNGDTHTSDGTIVPEPPPLGDNS